MSRADHADLGRYATTRRRHSYPPTQGGTACYDCFGWIDDPRHDEGGRARCAPEQYRTRTGIYAQRRQGTHARQLRAREIEAAARRRREQKAAWKRRKRAEVAAMENRRSADTTKPGPPSAPGSVVCGVADQAVAFAAV